jgi:hypothetical protein
MFCAFGFCLSRNGGMDQALVIGSCGSAAHSVSDASHVLVTEHLEQQRDAGGGDAAAAIGDDVGALQRGREQFAQFLWRLEGVVGAQMLD